MTLVIGRSAEVWREWLAEHGRSATEAWLVIHHQRSGVPSVRYAEAIEQALCFGWIDGLHRSHDERSSRLRFTPRRPTSTWSAVNRERATRMIEQGLMTEAGQALIDLARASDTWSPVAAGVPDDLRARLAADPVARDHFEGFPPSSKRLILEWVAAAKRPATRERRLARTVELAARNLRANHPGATGQLRSTS